MSKIARKYLRSGALKDFLDDEFKTCFERDFMLSDDGEGGEGRW